MISVQRLKSAGYFALIDAFFTILSGLFFACLYYLFREETDIVLSESSERIFINLTTVIAAAIYVYILSTFRRLLVEQYNFYRINIIINLLIITVITVAVLRVLPIVNVEMSDYIGIIGIINVIMGIKLLGLNDSLYGMRKLFSYTTIFIGICYAVPLFISVILLRFISLEELLGVFDIFSELFETASLPGLIAGIVLMIIIMALIIILVFVILSGRIVQLIFLAIIFFRASKEMAVLNAGKRGIVHDSPEESRQ